MASAKRSSKWLVLCHRQIPAAAHLAARGKFSLASREGTRGGLSWLSGDRVSDARTGIIKVLMWRSSKRYLPRQSSAAVLWNSLLKSLPLDSRRKDRCGVSEFGHKGIIEDPTHSLQHVCPKTGSNKGVGEQIIEHSALLLAEKRRC